MTYKDEMAKKSSESMDECGETDKEKLLWP